MEDEIKELPTQNGVYTEIIETEEIPKLTDEEINNKEYEKLPDNEEGGK